jgi:serine/threonine protein kinase
MRDSILAMPSTGPHSGRRFGPYSLNECLGSGAFKSVYRAVFTGDSTAGIPPIVAVAIPHQQDAEGIEIARRESETGRRLDHPAIVRTFALECHDGVWFLVMEYAEGESLHRRLRDGGPVAPAETLRLMILVAEALAYAHDAHVIHRDIKPDNIRLTPDGQPRILDFGIARVQDYTGQKAYTQVGTCSYMAPEVMQGRADTRADLWSLGVTAYELLTGRRPFDGETGEAVIRSVLAGRYDDKPLFERGVDRTLVRILRKLLQRDPDHRYQTAHDLLRDLDATARNIRLLDDDEGRLEALLKASVPLISVLSHEEERVLDALRAIARRQAEESRKPRPCLVWSASRGLRDEGGRLLGQETIGDPTAALDHVITSPDASLYVFLDLHRHYSPVTTRLIRDAARVVRTTRKSLVFVSPFYSAPPELEKEVHLTAFQLPDPPLLERTVAETESALAAEGVPVELTGENREDLVRAALGLTQREAVRALRHAASRHGSLDARAVRAVIDIKTQAIRRSGVLDYIHDPGSFSEVGGLKNLLTWFQGRARFFGLASRLPGVDQPKGVLLVGHPGCGKSLCARALAGAWGVPLIRLDVGRLFGSLLGQSEANLRQAIQTAEAVAPCILWIDEVEKGFAGARGGGGASVRVFGRFLEWLSEKRSPVFVVATANDLRALPPEFLRKGRFDETFYVPLPGEAERRDIFRIHVRRRSPADAAQFDPAPLAAATPGFSGAEIEAAVSEGCLAAFAEGRPLVAADLTTAAGAIRPLAQTRPEDFASLAAWAAQNAKPAA